MERLFIHIILKMIIAGIWFSIAAIFMGLGETLEIWGIIGILILYILGFMHIALVLYDIYEAIIEKLDEIKDVIKN